MHCLFSRCNGCFSDEIIKGLTPPVGHQSCISHYPIFPSVNKAFSKSQRGSTRMAVGNFKLMNQERALPMALLKTIRNTEHRTPSRRANPSHAPAHYEAGY